MKDKIIVEVMKPELRKNHYGTDFCLVGGLDIRDGERYWIEISKEDFGDIQEGDIFEVFGERTEGVLIHVTEEELSIEGKYFRAEKADLVARYSKKVREVLDI
jgi:hypothetical protein